MKKMHVTKISTLQLTIRKQTDGSIYIFEKRPEVVTVIVQSGALLLNLAVWSQVCLFLSFPSDQNAELLRPLKNEIVLLVI